MKKIIIFSGAAVLLLAIGAGGVFAFLKFGGGPTVAQAAKPPPPAPIYFAELPDVIVSISDDSGDPPSEMLDLTLQFQTGTADQVANFATLEPIIRSQVIGLLMSQTAKTLSSQTMRTQIENQSLHLVNNELVNRNYAPKAPFTAAFITNLVVQD